MLKVLHIIPCLLKGGAERLCLDIVRYSSKEQGVQVKLALLSNVNEYEFEYPEIKPIILNDYVIPSITSSWKVKIEDYKKLVEEFRPDVIHTHLFQADFFVHYHVYPQIKYITHCHDNIQQLSTYNVLNLRSKQRVTHMYERFFITKKYKEVNNHFIAISKNNDDYLKHVLPRALKANVHFLQNAIDTHRFKQDVLNPLKQPIQLINIGSFVPKKNQKFLIDVLLQLNKKKVKTELVLIGDGVLKEDVKAYALQKNVLEQIRFLGKVNKVEDFLKMAHIYVHSATYEPFGLVLLEAMASKLPIVCLDGKGNRDLIENGKNGYILVDENAELFADKILELVNNDKIYQSMSAKAVEFAQQHGIERYVGRLIKLYNTIK